MIRWTGIWAGLLAALWCWRPVGIVTLTRQPKRLRQLKRQLKRRLKRRTTTTEAVTAATQAATTTTEAVTADPQTCEEVADVLIAITQEFLDELGDMSVEEFEALLGAANEQGTPWPAFDKRDREERRLFERAEDELGCSDDDFQRLVFSEGRFDELAPGGPAGELWLEIVGEGAFSQPL